MRAFAGPSHRDKWRVRITVKRPAAEAGGGNVAAEDASGGLDGDDGPQWSYFGRMNGHEQSDEEVKEGCRMLRLDDAMVKKLCLGRR